MVFGCDLHKQPYLRCTANVVNAESFGFYGRGDTQQLCEYQLQFFIILAHMELKLQGTPNKLVKYEPFCNDLL